MKVALTGATGFTGSYVLPCLRAAGHDVRCLVRRPEAAAGLRAALADVVVGDLADPAALRETFTGCEALVNVASLGFGHAAGIVAAAEAAGVSRAVFVSTTAIFTSLNAGSKATRLAAEDTVMHSRLRWTILRPTMIYGSGHDRNICRLIRWVRRIPVLPVFGSGKALMQPVYVEDLANAIVAALATSIASGRAYAISGREPLSYNALVETVARLQGRSVTLWHLPHRPVVAALGWCERHQLRLPLKAEQILRLQEDKAFDWSEAAGDFGYAPRSFADGVALELAALRLTV